MSRSLSSLILGILLAAVGGVIASEAAYGLGLLIVGIGAAFAQVGLIGCGVLAGMRDYHEGPPRSQRDDRPRRVPE